MAKLAFLGLGVMGYPMAGHLQKAGHEVTSITAPPPRQRNGRQSMGAASPPPRALRPRAQMWFCLAWAMTMICAPLC